VADVDTLLLDTNIVSFLMKGDSRQEAYRPHLIEKTLTISFMTVAELYEGAYSARWGSRKLTMLEAQIKRYLVIPYSPRLCLSWGQIRAARRRQPIAVDDAWIAATALTYGIPLVTHNPADFHGIQGLEILTEHRV
jgi:predicted nucleic acid-binding protein